MLGGLLRELALGLHSPVLALASQNRSAGNYGNGKGTAALDSLKESGDLEYAADVVLFLTEAQERMATPPARAVDLTVAKNRHGDTGKVHIPSDLVVDSWALIVASATPAVHVVDRRSQRTEKM